MDLAQDISGKKVLVSLTGRIDSFVAAFLLQKQGMQVYGLTVVTCDSDLVDDLKFLPKCHISELDRINEFCEKLQIPMFATDAKNLYEEFVLDPFISNRLTGRANYTCMDCTKMRMQVIFNKMQELKLDYIATGHYAKVTKNLHNKRFFIQTSNDLASDQSMLLSGLDQEILSHLILPLGELKKLDVHKIAKSFSLDAFPSSKQVGYCFPKALSNQKIINDRVAKSLQKEGEVFNLETGTQPTTHSGSAKYYITQKDFVFNSRAVIEKDLEIVDYDFLKNSIVIGKSVELLFDGVQLSRLDISEGVDRSRPLNCFVKLDELRPALKSILYFKNNDTAYLELSEKVYPVLKSEFIVIYDGNGKSAKVLGSGKVQTRGKFKLIDRVEEFRKKVVDENGELRPDGNTKLFKF